MDSRIARSLIPRIIGKTLSMINGRVAFGCGGLFSLIDKAAEYPTSSACSHHRDTHTRASPLMRMICRVALVQPTGVSSNRMLETLTAWRGGHAKRLNVVSTSLVPECINHPWEHLMLSVWYSPSCCILWPPWSPRSYTRILCSYRIDSVALLCRALCG